MGFNTPGADYDGALDGLEDLDDDVIDYYVPSTDVESPSVHTPRCPYCGSLCKEGDLNVYEQNSAFRRFFAKDGYCEHCGCPVTFDHQWAIESVVSNRVHVRQNYTEEELMWRDNGSSQMDPWKRI